MTVYATIDGAGRATGFYPSALFPEPPAGAIEIGDALHAAWIAAPGLVLVNGVLVDPPVTPPTKAELVAYANAEQWRRATAGHSVTISGQSVTFPTDPTSQSLMTGKAARLDQPGAADPFRWQLPSGWITISVADFRATAVAIADYVQATFDALEPIETAIEAGSITTFAEIDAADWPA